MMLRFTPVLMVKDPFAGRSKTRLVGAGAFSAEEATAIARAMLECTIRRLGEFAASRDWELTVAVTPDLSIDRFTSDFAEAVDRLPTNIVPQGQGSLGERLLRIWRRARGDSTAFFGMDAPDLPSEFLAKVERSITDCDVVIGPTEDGGYWTIGGAEPQPAVCREIPWGSDSVFRVTLERVREAGLHCTVLPSWCDVDVPGDVDRLLKRIENQLDSGERDAALSRLHDQLTAIGAVRRQRTGSPPSG